jgi:CheY-like chemotaxis protein
VAVHSGGEGKGSEFAITLPKSEPPILAKTDSDGQPSHVSKRSVAPLRIVAVDDNRDAVDSLAKILRMKGHDVRTGYDGIEAVELAADFRPQVVLLDIGLPRLNGYEVAQRMRKLPGGSKIVLVAVTGWGQDEDRKRSEASGFDMHLVKPVDPLALDQLIANIDDSQAQLR